MADRKTRTFPIDDEYKLRVRYTYGWKKNCGNCDAPGPKLREIRIDGTLRGQEKLDALLHELTHFWDWRADEGVINHSATVTAHVLWELGLRFLDEE